MRSVSALALYPMTVVLLALISTSCKPSSISGGGAGDDSIVASIPGIDNGLRQAIQLTYTLNCDPSAANLANPKQKVTAVDNQNAATTSVSFTNAAAITPGMWCAMLVTDANTNDPNLSHYRWTSANQQKGLFFGSNAAQLTASRSLTLTLYTTYIDTNAPQFSPTFTVTLPAGATNTNPTPASGTLTCNNVSNPSNQATALGTTQISYIFPLQASLFASTQSCNLGVTTGSGSYSSSAPISVINTTTQYSNINLVVATAAATGSGVNVTVQSGGNCPFNPATMTCSGTAANAVSPVTPVTSPATGSTTAAPATNPAAGTVQVATNPQPTTPPTPVGAQGLWLDQNTDANAPFPSSMLACKGAAIINEGKMQVALGYYCWLNVAQGNLAAGSFVVDIEYFGNITSEANNELDWQNGSVGCDVASLNQSLYTDFQIQSGATSGTILALSVGDTPEYMAHWQNSPNLSTSSIPIGCIDQNSGTFHSSDAIKNALLPMMVY